MRFKGLDLNLLVALDALLDTRSVSRAAERLNSSQPAMSAALSRLREYFRDDILVANAKRMHPTAFAEGLAPQLRDCLRNVDTLVSSSTSFDPLTSQRAFSIVASDYVMAAVLAPLVATLAELAPGVRIDLLAPGEESARQFVAGDADLLVAPEGFHQPNFPAAALFADRHVVVGCGRNPIFRRPLNEEDVLSHGHVTVVFGPQRASSFADRQLAAMGKTRNVEITTATFTSVPWLLHGTSRLSLMHERLARVMAVRFPIVFQPLPFDFPLMTEVVQHHPARSKDDGLIWMRGLLHRVADLSIHDLDENPSIQSDLQIA